MSTYSSNAEVKLDTGRSINSLLDEDLEPSEVVNVIRAARERAFNHINAQLAERTAVPAFHIPVLKQVEVDIALSDILMGAFTMETANTSEWAEKYRQRASDAMASLNFGASVEEPAPYRNNVGNGRLKVTDVNSDYAKTEQFVFMALSPSRFTVLGSVSGRYPDIEVGVNYPDTDWTGVLVADYGLRSPSLSFSEFPFYCRITSGSVPFAIGDNFKLRVYASSSKIKGMSIGKIIRA